MTLLVHPTLLPTPATPVLLHYRDENGKPHFTTPANAALVRFEQSSPVREIPRYHDQKHTPGLYWSASDRQHLAYESYLECQWMTMLDFDPHVIALRAQPMRIQCLDSGGSWEHVPDLFVRLSDGSARVIDVKNPQRINDADVQLQAARTREICERIGFEFTLVSQPPPIPWSNIRWLAAYRRPFALPAGLQERVIEQAIQTVRIDDLVGAFDLPELARTAALRACWFGQLTFDLHAPLRDSSLVHATRESS